MNILSLFDGISCGQLALKKINVHYNYFASEIDKKAILVTQKNFPNTIQLGDVNNWSDWILPDIDLLIGGSPCQGFSVAGKHLNFNDRRSKLFFKFVEVLNYQKPKYFLLENVLMKKEWQDIISKYLKVKPILINSALVSAQNRKRLYWTNILNITQPINRHIYLKDVLEDGKLALGGAIRGRPSKNGNIQQQIECNKTQKSNALTTVQKDTVAILIDEPCKIKSFSSGNIRKLTPLECERLQTISDNYTSWVSNSQRYKLIGNAWTVDVIAHILRSLLYYKNNNGTV